MSKFIDESDKSFYEAFNSREKFMQHESDQMDFNNDLWKPFEKYQMDKYKLKFGDIFLYQIVDKNKISYPKLATFVKYMMMDMALELQFVDSPRTWEYNVKFLSNPELDIYMPVCERSTEFSYHIEWDQVMFIFGHWKQMPSWKELRQAYERSIWFYKDQSTLRDQQLKRLL
jgi:hypothetical protein